MAKLKLTRSEEKDILYKYIIKRERLVDIHGKYANQCTYGYFTVYVANWLMRRVELLHYICTELRNKHEFIYFSNAIQGHKTESYYEDEYDCVFYNATYNRLSTSEKLIYDRQERESQKNNI